MPIPIIIPLLAAGAALLLLSKPKAPAAAAPTPAAPPPPGTVSVTPGSITPVTPAGAEPGAVPTSVLVTPPAVSYSGAWPTWAPSLTGKETLPAGYHWYQVGPLWFARPDDLAPVAAPAAASTPAATPAATPVVYNQPSPVAVPAAAPAAAPAAPGTTSIQVPGLPPLVVPSVISVPGLPPITMPSVVALPSVVTPTPIQTAEQHPAVDTYGTIALAAKMIDRETGAGWKTALKPEITAWQNLVGLTADGLFGVKSEMRMATEVGILPLVRYWPANSVKATTLAAYKAALEALAQTLDATNHPHAVGLRSSAAFELGQAYTGTPAAISPSLRGVQGAAIASQL